MTEGKYNIKLNICLLAGSRRGRRGSILHRHHWVRMTYPPQLWDEHVCVCSCEYARVHFNVYICVWQPLGAGGQVQQSGSPKER